MMSRAMMLLRISAPQTRTYAFVTLVNVRLNQSKNPFNNPPRPSFGFNNNADSAGLSVSALNADKITEIAIVTANCWYNRPVIPGINAGGTNTADNTSALPTTGPEMSSIALRAAACVGWI